jgi:hypothetical protein
MDLAPTDRVLVLAISSPDELRRIAGQVPNGLVVALLDREAVYATRAALRELTNIMIAPSNDGELIPWRDEFFTAVYAPAANEPTQEMLRVVPPGGTVIVAGGPVTKR